MDQNNRIAQLLRRSQLSITPGRKEILSLFLSQEGALAHHDVEKRAGLKLDRVTVYRTLQTFLEKGIIHTIPSSDNAVRYALCKSNCSDGHHHDDHVHFECMTCGDTVCLDEVHIPRVQLPTGFKPLQVEMVVKGVCKKCK